jgi:hypothetical protein
MLGIKGEEEKMGGI